MVNAGNKAGNYQVRDLAEVVAAELPGTKVSINRRRRRTSAPIRSIFRCSLELAPEHLPAVPLAQSVRNLAPDCAEWDFRTGEFRTSPLMRLKTLKDHIAAGPAVARPPLAVILKGTHRMKFHATPLHGAYTIELEKRGDDRGFFARFFCQKEFEAAGVPMPIVQINNSLSAKGRHPARDALPIGAGRRNQGGALHPRRPL